MKRNVLFILLVFVFSGLSAVAGYAGTTPNLDPGCDPQMMQMLTDQANAVRSRDKAYEMEIISREPSTLYLTCFDQAMALSARLGYIFSDNVTPNPPPPNTLAFKDALLYPDWGATHSLAVDLDNVVTPILDQWLGNTPTAVPDPGSGAGGSNIAPTNPAVQNFYPNWTTPNALSNMTQDIRTQISNIQSQQSSLQTQVTNYNNLVVQIDNLVNSFPSLSWSTLPDNLTTYNTDISNLNSMISSIQSSENSTIGPLLSNIKNDVFNAKMMCTNLDDVWNGAGNFANPSNSATSFYSPEGPYNTLTPFYSMADLLNYNEGASTMTTPLKVPPNNTGVATFYFNTELTRNTDNGLLQTALNDLIGPLSKPGYSTLWPAPPTLPSYFQTQDVINQM